MLMKKLITCIFVLSAFIVLSSCDSDSDPTAIQKIAAIKTEPTAVEKIINNNSFIDIDLSQIPIAAPLPFLGFLPFHFLSSKKKNNRKSWLWMLFDTYLPNNGTPNR